MSVVTVTGEPMTLLGEPVTVGEEPVSIPGVETFHPRAVWVEPCFPVSGRAQAPLADDIYQPIAHYSAAANTPDGDIGEFDYQIIPWLRSVNRDYWINRTNTTTTTICGRVLPGYSIGYLFAIDWLGGVWELRGFDYMPAANAPHNHYTAPLLFITDGATPATDLAWESARAVWREFRRRSGRADFRNRPLGHGEIAATSCPGSGLLSQLHAGLGDLDYDDSPEDDMAFPVLDRLLDTRKLGGKVVPGQVIELSTKHAGTVAAINFTVTESEAAGFLTAWPRDAKPETSNLNWDGPGQTRANLAMVPLNGDRFLFTIDGPGPAHIIVDLQAVLD
jgi:hypothetical protein